MGARFVRVLVLVRPERAFDLLQQRPYPLETRRQELAGLPIRLGDEVDLGAVSTEDFQVLGGRFGIDDTDEAQPVISAGLRQADAHVSRARFDDYGILIQETSAQALLEDVESRSVLYATARIEGLQLGEDLRPWVRKELLQADERSVADRGEHVLPYQRLGLVEVRQIQDLARACRRGFHSLPRQLHNARARSRVWSSAAPFPNRIPGDLRKGVKAVEKIVSHLKGLVKILQLRVPGPLLSGTEDLQHHVAEQRLDLLDAWEVVA